jgi:hypothetical protein
LARQNAELNKAAQARAQAARITYDKLNATRKV